MSKIIPFFELNGQKYEIKPTRWLIAEYDKLGEESQLSNEDKANAIKAQTLIGDIQRYAEKVKELEEKYFETFDNEDEWFEADAALVDFNAKQEYLSNLGYVSDPIPVESIAGATYTHYDMHLAGDFLIIEESVILDV